MRDRLSKLSTISPMVWALLLGLAILAIYSASIGACGPWDPWETHYGEVARNMVVRHDPMDLWWRPGAHGPQAKREGVFASKHALPFWCMALSFKLFGVGDGAIDEMVRSPIPEIALRLPSMLMGLGTVALLGWCVARLVHWRAGLLTAAVLATMPQYAILTRQAVTDMFFVAPVCLAMVGWAMAWLEPERELKTIGRQLGNHGLLEVPWDRAWVGFFVVFVIGAVVPLAVLHLHVVDPDTIATVARSRRKSTATVDDLRTIAQQLSIYWVVVAAVLLRSVRWRRRSQAWMGVVYVAGGLSLMGKGMIGPGIIGLLILVDMLVNGRLHLLWQRRCELAVGILLFVVTCFPWHHAMAIFRGESWVNELIVVNNLARFATGEQKQAVGGFAFYLRTLGLAALPWSAVVPPALWAAVLAYRRRDCDRDRDQQAEANGSRPCQGADSLHRLALLWFVVSFGLITYSVTKYYHYLVPCLPPLGIVIGIWLHRLMPTPARDQRASVATSAEAERAPVGDRLPVAAALACALSGCAVLYMVARATLDEPAWIAHLSTYLYTGMWREGAAPVDRMVWCLLPFGVGLLLWVANKGRLAVAGMLLSALLTTAWVIDDYLPATSENWSQRSAFRHAYDHIGTAYNHKDEKHRLLSWWFYYRGETYFSKRQIWVSMEPDRQKLRELVDDYRGKNTTFWVMTTARHAERAHAHFPPDLRDHIEVVYRNFHYALLKVEIP